MSVLNTNNILHFSYEPLKLPQTDYHFLGKLPSSSQFKMLIYGGAFAGKSSYALHLANILSRFGNVLYGNFEEPITGGTLQNKLKITNVRSSNIFFLEPNNWQNFIKELNTNKYKFAFIDSISVLGDTRKEVFDKFNIYKIYPKISFVFIAHADKKQQTYIGASALRHDVDITIEVQNKIAYLHKNRFKTNNNCQAYNIFKKQCMR